MSETNFPADLAPWLGAIIESAGAGIAILDATGNLVAINPAGARFFSYPASELTGRNYRELTHPEDLEESSQLFESVVSGRQSSVSTDKRYIRRDGSVIWGRVTLSRVECSAQGAEPRLLVVYQDVSELHRAAAELSRVNRALRVLGASNQALVRAVKEEQLLQDLCDILIGNGKYSLAWIGFSVHDEAKSIRLMAAAGVASEYIRNTPLTWADTPRGQGPGGTAVRTGRVMVGTTEEARFAPWKEAIDRYEMGCCAGFPLRAGGTVFGALAIYGARQDTFDALELDLLTGLSADLSYGIQALRERAALRLSEQRLARAQRIASLGSWEFDIRSRSILWSAECSRICGIDPQIAPTLEAILAQVHPDERARVYEAMEASVATGAEYDVEHRIVRPDGNIRILHAHGEGIRDDSGALVSITGTVQDITEHRRLEEQFQVSQKLESVGRLAGGVAHDFNNLLTVINGYSELLLGQLEPVDPLRGPIEEISRAGERAAGLTQQLLAFSRRQVLQPRVLDLNAVLGDTGNMLRRLIGEDIELITTLPAGIGRVMADAGQVHQVLMNLVVNARDAMPGGGRLLIETANVDLDSVYAEKHPAVKPGPYVMLAVSDTGIGMDEATQAHLFEPFFTTKATGAGTGLGLSTVYGIVKQSNGSVWVYSEVGKGTTVKVYLPRVDAETTDAAAPQRPAAGELRGSETVLVVEDQAEVRALAREILTTYGYRVLEAANAGEALLLSERYAGPIHLMLTDVIMPGITGRELASRLSGVRPEMKIMFMSGYTDNVLLQGGVLDPGAGYVQKPFTPEKLLGPVRAVLGPPRTMGRILVVDDEEGIRRLLRQILESAGYEVAEAVNGREALLKVEARSTDLVITDLVMPDQEGLETIRALLRQYPSIKVIAISGAFGGAFLKPAQLMGVQAAIPKPIRPDVLLKTVRQVLGIQTNE